MILRWLSHNRFRIQKVFCDEIHLIPDALRGPPLKEAVKWLRQFNMQMITLSATLSRRTETLMLNLFLSSRKDTVFIRSSVDRPEQSIQVLSVSRDDLLDAASQLAKAVGLALKPNERCVVFFNDVESLDKVADSCHATRYHSQLPMTGDTKEWNLEAFMTGEHKVMAATTSLSLGFHHDSVRVVIVVNGSYGLREVVQQFGRGGRDGKPTICYFISVKGWNQIASHEVSAYICCLASLLTTRYRITKMWSRCASSCSRDSAGRRPS